LMESAAPTIGPCTRPFATTVCWRRNEWWAGTSFSKSASPLRVRRPHCRSSNIA
jgi:hypothetical protein